MKYLKTLQAGQNVIIQNHIGVGKIAKRGYRKGHVEEDMGNDKNRIRGRIGIQVQHYSNQPLYNHNLLRRTDQVCRTELYLRQNISRAWEGISPFIY